MPVVDRPGERLTALRLAGQPPPRQARRPRRFPARHKPAASRQGSNGGRIGRHPPRECSRGGSIGPCPARLAGVRKFSTDCSPLGRSPASHPWILFGRPQDAANGFAAARVGVRGRRRRRGRFHIPSSTQREDGAASTLPCNHSYHIHAPRAAQLRSHVPAVIQIRPGSCLKQQARQHRRHRPTTARSTFPGLSESPPNHGCDQARRRCPRVHDAG